MKNLKQIAEDSSYSFGMTSGQKGERFLAYARNDQYFTSRILFYFFILPGKQRNMASDQKRPNSRAPDLLG